MDFRESKLEWMMIVLAGVLLLGVLSIFRYFEKPSQIETTADVAYEMPRPGQSEGISEFSLGDREIIRQYVNQNKPVGAAANKNAPAAAAPKKNAKKKKDDKKKAAAKSRGSSVEIDIVEADETRMKSDDLDSNPQRVTPIISEKTADIPPLVDEEKKPVKSLQEWRSLLLSQPTKANMDEFLAAWRAGEVDANGFYQVTSELIAIRSKDPQNLALYALQAVPHLRSFTTIARSMPNLTAENQIIARQILMTYSHPNRLNILSQALKTDDINVVRLAAEVVTFGLSRAKSGQGTDPRQSRGQITPLNVNAYAPFVVTFQQFLQSGDSVLVSLANSFLSNWPS